MQRAGRNHQVGHQHRGAGPQFLPQCRRVAAELVTVNPVVVNQRAAVNQLQRDATLESQMRVALERVRSQSTKHGAQPLSSTGAAFEHRHDVLRLGCERGRQVFLEFLPHLFAIARERLAGRE